MSNHSKCKQLRTLLESGELEFILEAHNGVSASIVERAGFKGIWGSGLALSAQFGVRSVHTNFDGKPISRDGRNQLFITTP